MGECKGPLSDGASCNGSVGPIRHTEPVVEDGEVVEDVCHLPLIALLHDLVREEGNRDTAEAPGIDSRTDGLVHEKGKAVGRVSKVLERRVLTFGPWRNQSTIDAVQGLLHQSHNGATLELRQRK